MIANKNIDGGNAFDWGYTSEKYAQFRNIYPKELYDKLRELGVAADGTSWLDLGTGTGILPQNLYNPKAKITGVDISEEQIYYAKLNAKENGWDINYFVAPAEKTGLSDGSFDSITAAQCFWYFDREIMKSEIKRLLKPNGKFIKIYFTYTFDDEIAVKSHQLVKSFNTVWAPASSTTSSTTSGAKDIFDDLFDGRKTETFYCDIPFTKESWHGRMCACRGTLASMDSDTFSKWSESHLKMLSDCPESFTIKHKVYITYFEL